MKVGLLTLPLHSNYGGLLQAFALQESLKRLGHDVILLDRKESAGLHGYPWYVELSFFLKREYRRLTGRIRPVPEDFNRIILQNTDAFIARYIERTGGLLNSKQLRAASIGHGLNAIVVGSDQVWRARYSPQLYNYFLDFTEGLDIRRISYAASFGTDSFEYKPWKISKCRKLIRRFDAISVRESSGVGICSKELGKDAVNVLDPALLLEPADYESIIETDGSGEIEGDLFCYVLDIDEDIRRKIKSVSEKNGMAAFQCMPSRYDDYDHPCDCIYPPVSKWLKSIRNSRMVITNSFHGAALSILFNRPFWVFENGTRGMERFSSLLKTFGLESRMITLDTLDSTDLSEPVDWERVNSERERLKAVSLGFIEDALG